MSVVRLLSAVLAKKNGWPRAYAEGYAAGEALRLEGKILRSYAITERDDWALGFRAGQFDHQNPASSQARTTGVLETA
jgi:hypothetical protein